MAKLEQFDRVFEFQKLFEKLINLNKNRRYSKKGGIFSSYSNFEGLLFDSNHINLKFQSWWFFLQQQKNPQTSFSFAQNWNRMQNVAKLILLPDDQSWLKSVGTFLVRYTQYIVDCTTKLLPLKFLFFLVPFEKKRSTIQLKNVT